MNQTTQPRLGPWPILVGGALPASLIGLLEASGLLFFISEDPGLDLDSLSFATVSYAVVGMILAAVLYPLQRALGAATRTPLFPWRLRELTTGGLFRAWLFNQSLLWLVLVAGSGLVRLGLQSPLATPKGLGAMAAAGLVALVVGWFLIPRQARKVKEGPPALSTSAALMVVIAIGVLVPYALQEWVYRVDERPGRTAFLRNPEYPAAPRPIEPQAEVGPPTEQYPDVLVITLDTTRADHLSAYGYERDTTPELEAFAKEAVRFDRAYSASSWTVPSHATLFTGLFPHSHGARYKSAAEHEAEVDHTSVKHNTWIRALDPDHVTMAEMMKAYGYATGGFIAGTYMDSRFGMAQGFDWYDDRISVSIAPKTALYGLVDGNITELEPDLFRFGHGYRRGDEVNASVFDWLEKRDDERFFLFVNYFDAHQPYWPVAEYRNRYPGSDLSVNKFLLRELFQALMLGKRELKDEELQWLISQYDAEIRFQDEQMGHLFQYLKDMGRWDEMLVIVTADHGEHLGEGGQLSHGFTVYGPVTHIPMLVKFPTSDGVAAGTRSYPVHLADVLPTVIKRLGMNPQLVKRPMQGRDLFDDSVPHDVINELFRDNWRVARFGEKYSREIRAWVTEQWHIFQNQPLTKEGIVNGEPYTELFDPNGDPEYLRNVAEEQPTVVRQMLDNLEAWFAKAEHFVASEFLGILGEGDKPAALAETGYADDAE